MNDFEQTLAIARGADLDEPLTKQQAAAWAKVSTKTIERFMAAGLRYYPGPRFTKRDLQLYMESVAINQFPKLRRTA